MIATRESAHIIDRLLASAHPRLVQMCLHLLTKFLSPTFPAHFTPYRLLFLSFTHLFLILAWQKTSSPLKTQQRLCKSLGPTYALTVIRICKLLLDACRRLSILSRKERLSIVHLGLRKRPSLRRRRELLRARARAFLSKTNRVEAPAWTRGPRLRTRQRSSAHLFLSS